MGDYRTTKTTAGVRYVHREIAARALGRPLPPGAEVHHVDGNPQNNATSNLVICHDAAYHALLHMRAKVVRAGGDPNTERFCGQCGRCKPATAFAERRDGRGGGRTSNCKECGRAYWWSKQGKRVARRLEQNKLAVKIRALLNEGRSQSSVARMVGVNQSTVSRAATGKRLVLYCVDCLDRGRRVAAENLDSLRDYPGATPRCGDCEAGLGEALDAARFAAYHGGGLVTIDEQMAEARRAKL